MQKLMMSRGEPADKVYGAEQRQEKLQNKINVGREMEENGDSQRRSDATLLADNINYSTKSCKGAGS